MKIPCNNCPDRHLHCHSECEKYQKFVGENEKKKEFMRLENDFTNAKIDRLIKWRIK